MKKPAPMATARASNNVQIDQIKPQDNPPSPSDQLSEADMQRLQTTRLRLRFGMTAEQAASIAVLIYGGNNG